MVTTGIDFKEFNLINAIKRVKVEEGNEKKN